MENKATKQASTAQWRTDGEQQLLDDGGVGDEAVVGAKGDAEPVGQHVLEAVVRDVVAQLRHGLHVRRQAHLCVVCVFVW